MNNYLKYKFDDDVVTLTYIGKCNTGMICTKVGVNPEFIYKHRWNLSYKNLEITLDFDNEAIPTKEEIIEEMLKYFNHFSIRFLQEAKLLKKK